MGAWAWYTSQLFRDGTQEEKKRLSLRHTLIYLTFTEFIFYVLKNNLRVFELFVCCVTLLEARQGSMLIYEGYVREALLSGSTTYELSLSPND